MPKISQKLRPGTTCLLATKRLNGIQPMVEVVSADEKWVRWIGAFGGSRIRRSRRSRVVRILGHYKPTR
jgi:hypothetical protein